MRRADGAWMDGDVAVVGAGPAGLAAALALAAEGARVIVAAPALDRAAAARDTRTIALMGPSVDLLINLGAWPAIAPHTTAIEAIRLIDARGGLLRAPETVFRAAESGRAAFGANVPVARLVEVLEELARGLPSPSWGGGKPTIGSLGLPPSLSHKGGGDAGGAIEFLDGVVAEIRPMPEAVEIGLASGEHRRVRLVIGADGRASRARAAAGIGAETWSYPQSAVTATFEHARGHGRVSTEFHRAGGPLTTVPARATPAGAHSSGLVWVERPERAEALAALAADAFAHELEVALQGLLGRVGAVGPRALFPIGGLKAERMAARRIALIGEAAHALPPIGAQGFNLSLRDVAWLAQLAGAALRAGGDPGGGDVLAAYEAARASDVRERTTGVHWLNQVLLIDAFPVQSARGLGLHLLANSLTARRAAIERGLAPSGPLPRMMRVPHDKG